MCGVVRRVRRRPQCRQDARGGLLLPSPVGVSSAVPSRLAEMARRRRGRRVQAASAGGLWLVVVPAVLACHGVAFAILQLGFQRGTALATAGPSSLFTNALPIAAGVAVFHEQLPAGARGIARVVAFACVVAAAAVLARRESGEP
jgi:hypothetical protein